MLGHRQVTYPLEIYAVVDPKKKNKKEKKAARTRKLKRSAQEKPGLRLPAAIYILHSSHKPKSNACPSNKPGHRTCDTTDFINNCLIPSHKK